MELAPGLVVIEHLARTRVLDTYEVFCAEREIECPQHGSVFSLVTGEPDSLPATQPVPVFDVTVDGDTVTIRSQDEAAT